MLHKSDYPQLIIEKWVLPREEVPVQIRWHSKEILSEIYVTVPQELEIVDVLNVGVDGYKINNNKIHAFDLRKSLKNAEFGYFGVILTAPHIDQIKKSYPIMVELIYESKKPQRLEGDVRVFRPMLKLVNAPKIFELNDENANNAEIKLDLMYYGFGEIQISLGATIDQKIIIERQNFLNVLLKQIIRMIRGIKTDQELEYVPEIVKISLNPETNAQIRNDILKTIDEDPNISKDVQDALNDPKIKKKFREIINERIPDLTIRIIDDFVKRHPTENVSLGHPSTLIIIPRGITSVTVRVNYRDLRKENYPPLDVPIQINDKRSSVPPDFSFNIPIRIGIGRIKEDPLLNVLEIDLND